MKKIGILLVALCLMLGMTACINNSTPEQGDESVKGYTMIIRGESVNLTSVTNAIYALGGKMLPLRDDTVAPAVGEIIFGNADRELTSLAAAYLDSILQTSGNPDGYIAYKKDGSVAVYWNNAALAEEAIARFVSECIESAGLELADGVIFSEDLDYDAILSAEKWQALEATAPADLVQAFKQMERFYDIERVIYWYASLYDPEYGAFYFAPSSRDYDGFLPDIESSAQVLNALRNAGMFYQYGDSYGGDALPAEISELLIEFVRERQSKDDGYFYHPQWGTAITGVKRGRDMTKALGILSQFGVEPKYPTALDNLGDYSDGDVDTVSALTSPLRLSTVSAVSRVVSAAEIDSRFESLESFDKWLKETTAKIKENSHNVGHTLSSSTSQIKAAGFLDYELDYLDRIQQEIYDEQVAAGLEPTGLFDLNCDYASASGLYKITGIYNSGKRVLKYADLAASSCIDIINIPANDPDHVVKNIVYAFNPWGALDRVIDNIENRHKNAELAASVKAHLLESGASVVYNTMTKLATLQKPDGSFSYYPDHTSSTMQGSYISLGLNEGDVTATGLAIAIYSNMFSTLGLEKVRLCDDSDRLLFIELLGEMLPVEKIPTTSGDPIGFDDGEIPVNVAPDIKSAGTVEVIPNPENAKDYILHYVSPKADNMDKVNFKTHGVGGNLYVAEFDINVLSCDQKTSMQLMMGSCYFIEVRNEGGRVALYDNSTTSNTKHAQALNITAEFGEWFKLRMEYYVLEDGVKIKVYKNGEFAAVSDNFMGKETEGKAPSINYDFMSFRVLKAANVELYLDNVVAVATTGEFTEDEPVKDSGVTTFDFEGGATAPKPSNTSNDKAAIVTDPTNPTNKMLSYEGLRTDSVGGQSIRLDASEASSPAGKKTVSFDLYVPSVDKDGDGVYNEYNGDLFTENNYGALMAFNLLTGGKKFSDLRIIVEKSDDGIVKALALSFNNGTDDVGAYSLSLDTKYTVSITYDFTGATPTATVTLNGARYMTSTNLYSSSYVADGGIAYDVTSMKRTKGAVYFDNITYTESD